MAAQSVSDKLKRMAPGGGGRFAAAVSDMTAKGLPSSEAAAIAAKQGRAKYGNAKFAAMGAAGRKRAAAKKKKRA